MLFITAKSLMPVGIAGMVKLYYYIIQSAAMSLYDCNNITAVCLQRSYTKM